MRIVVDGKKAFVQIGAWRYNLGELYQIACQKNGRNPASVALHAGVEHAQEYYMRTDKTNSAKTFVVLMDDLGYEVILRKKRS